MTGNNLPVTVAAGLETKLDLGYIRFRDFEVGEFVKPPANEL